MRDFRFRAALFVGALAAGLIASPAPLSAQRPSQRSLAQLPDDVSAAIREALEPLTSGALGRQIGDMIHDVVDEVSDVAALARAGARQNRSWTAKRVDTQTRAIAVPQTGTIELETIAGSITVVAGSGPASVEVLRESRGRTDADAAHGLDRVTADVDVRGDRARIRANYPDGERSPQYSVAVSFKLTAPAGTHVVARTVSGHVTVTDIKGDVSAHVTAGDITITNARVSDAHTTSGDIRLTDVTADGPLGVDTLSGDITLQHVTAKRLTAHTISGTVIAREMTCDQATLSTVSSDIEYGGGIAAGGRYELHSQSGDIRFRPSGTRGYAVEARTFSGDMRTAPGIAVRDLQSGKRLLKGTVGDGDAVVTLSTFSGDVTIGDSARGRGRTSGR